MNKIHDDNTFSEHGFVSSIPYKDGFMVSWLDGRNTTTKKSDSGHDQGAMTLRTAIINLEGALTEDMLLTDPNEALEFIDWVNRPSAALINAV